MDKNKIILITGTSRGIGEYLRDYYLKENFIVIGCSRNKIEFRNDNYYHFSLNVDDEEAVLQIFKFIKKEFNKLDILINNAGIASMNHLILTPLKTVNNIFRTNVFGTFLFCREAAKLMIKQKTGRIVNFATVATPLNLEGEAIYASSKAAIESMTKVFARELSDYNITINALGPTPIFTDLVKSVPKEKMVELIQRQAIKRYGNFNDISNVIDFFIKPESNFITGQIIFLGGVS